MTPSKSLHAPHPAHSIRPDPVVIVARRPKQDLTRAWLARDQTIPILERNRILSFRRWQDAMSSLLARRLMIDLVASSAGCEPRSVTLGREASGRPIVTSANHEDVQITAAHAGEWVAAAVSNRGQIGIDLEVERAVPVGLPERCFVASELDWMRSCGDSDGAPRFFQLWTLKEAFLKAVGQGLATDPRALTFDMDSYQSPLLTMAPSGFNVREWRFVSWQPIAGLWLSIASDDVLPTTYILNEDIAS
jgi:4'-phosphopantetheinyl transferase